MGFWTMRQSTTIYMPSTVENTEDWLTLLREDSPAHHSRLQASDWERLTTETSGLKPFGLYGKWDPASSSWKTSEDWLTGVTRTQRKLLGNFPRRGTICDGVCVPQKMPELPTSVGDGGVSGQKEQPFRFPTPAADPPGWKHITVIDVHGCEPPCHPNQRFYNKDTGQLVQKGLEQMVSWPTPDSSARGPNALDLVAENGRSVVRRGSGQRRGINLETATKLWPTPVADGDRRTNYQQGGTSLGYAVREETPVEGSLNPDWVEWLMGVPIGWTSLEPIDKDNYYNWLEKSKAGMWWSEEPPIPRLATKIKDRNKRLKALGNGIVPATLTGFIYDKND